MNNNKIEGTTYPPHVVFGVMLWAGLSLALVAAAWWYVGWIAAGVALVWTFLSYGVGITNAQWEIRGDGYILEKRKDGRGKTRWHVGIQAPAARVAPQVRWFVPGERDDPKADQAARVGGAWASKEPPPDWNTPEPPPPPPPPPITSADMHGGRRS